MHPRNGQVRCQQRDSTRKRRTDTETEGDVRVARERHADAVHLDSELTRRGHDDDAGHGVLAVAVEEALEDADPKGDRLSGTGRRRGDDVLAKHGERDAFGLDGRGSREIEGLEREEQLAGERAGRE